MGFFREQVLQACSLIPKGKVSTYKELAKFVSSPKSARAVGNALNTNENLISVPCHRVVKSNGGIGGYAKGTSVKISLLKKEGVRVSKSGRVDLREFFFKLN
jgi:methylated-DNA-[protein]-cysteine S-methyltransferase